MTTTREPRVMRCHWCDEGTVRVWRDTTGHVHGVDNLGLPTCPDCRDWLTGGAIGLPAGD